MPFRTPRVPISKMNEREQAQFFQTQGIQASQEVLTFTPTWNGFSVDPVGSINYKDYGSYVSLWVDTALTGVSDEAFMLATGMPSEIWPSGNRYIRCLLLDENNLRGGVVLITDSGGMAFSLETVEAVPTDTIGFNNVFTDPSFGGFKGLPAGWYVTYTR